MLKKKHLQYCNINIITIFQIHVKKANYSNYLNIKSFPREVYYNRYGTQTREITTLCQFDQFKSGDASARGERVTPVDKQQSLRENVACLGLPKRT